LSRTLTSVVLNYNNTNYTSSILANGNNYIFTNTITTPIVSTDTNISFYYLINIGEIIQTQSYNQTIQNVNITTTCPDVYDLINMTNYDEETLNQISANTEFTLSLLNINEEVLSTVYGNQSGASVQFCSNVNLSSSSSLYKLEVRYWKDGYFYKTYNIEPTAVTNLPISIDLYHLNQSKGTEFKIYYKDYKYLEHSGAIIQIQRQYLDENLYRIVEIPLITDDGSTTGSFSTNGVKYKLIVIENGVVLDIFENIFAKCQNLVLGTCEIKINGDDDQETVDEDDFSYTIEEGNNTFTITYIIPSGTPKSVSLILNQSSRFLDDISSCIQTVYASGGTLTCGYNNTLGDSDLQIEIVVNDEVAIQGNVLVTQDINTTFLSNNFFIAFILLLTLALMFVSSGTMLVLSGLVGLFFLGFIWLINMKSLNITLIGSSVAWLLLAGIILVIRISMKEDRT